MNLTAALRLPATPAKHQRKSTSLPGDDLELALELVDVTLSLAEQGRLDSHGIARVRALFNRLKR